MPIFVGICPEHGEFEAIMFRREATVPCTTCGLACEHEVTSASARFVGSGFYATDYRKPAPKAKDESSVVVKKNVY